MGGILGNDVFRGHGPLTSHNYIVPTKNIVINLFLYFQKMDILKMSKNGK